MNKTVTFYNPENGKLGPIITDTEEVINEKTQQYPFYIEGHHDIDSFLYDIKTNTLIDKPFTLSDNDLKHMRNSLLDSYRWTVMPDSPLTDDNKEEWLLYLKNLQSIFKDGIPELVEWPVKPDFVYEVTT